MIPFKKILNNFFQTILRFPAPILCGFLAFGFVFGMNHLLHEGGFFSKNFIIVKLAFEATAGISLFIAFDIFSEIKQVIFSKRLGFILLGFCVLGLHYYSIAPGMFSGDNVFLSRYLLFLLCFHLLVSFIAFYQSRKIKSFWQYNYFLFRRFMITLAYSITLFAGLASALWAVAVLFGFHFTDKYYLDIAAFVFLIFNTLYFLSGIPTKLEEYTVEQEFQPSVRIFVQYILLPIVLLYALILYAYMGKIIFTQHLPNGWVCIPILIFSVLGILAYLLVFPIRHDDRYKLIRVYTKYFFYFVLPLLSLYFISIYHRISPYGITEDRYLVLVLGLWLLIISVYIISSKRDNIIIIPMSLFILLSLSAIGPWGMFQLSKQNQLYHLESLLKKNDLLDEDKLITIKHNTKISSEHLSSMQSIFTYLNRRGEISAIKHWLRDSDKVALERAIKNNESYTMYALFGQKSVQEFDADIKSMYIEADSSLTKNAMISITDFHYIKKIDATEIDEEGQKNASESNIHYLIRNKLYVSNGAGSKLEFDLQPLVQNIFMNRKKMLGKKDQSNDISVANIELQSVQMSLPKDSLSIQSDGYKLMIETMNLFNPDTAFHIQYLNAYMLF
jgi:hypothetical protein